jgi:hypothetical protein
LETSAIILKRGRMAVIEAEANIQRSPQEVFDDCSNHIHEPEWNIKMKGGREAHRCPYGPRHSLPDGVHLGALRHQRVCALRATERVGDRRPVEGHDVWLEGPGAAER